ncbi:DUF6221 family protein [Nonomuraea sp. NPDC050404]|uniref:DUF6221 family protein n=1 Tax=Nonomuraea sp. NPDC050404 TaxID=3155783 RepID=UPI00340FAE98
MNDLVAFLRQRFDEEERIARDADGISRDAWMALYGDLITSRSLDDQRRVFGIFIGTFTSGRTLDDIAAKRRILELHRAVPYRQYDPPVHICLECSSRHDDHYHVTDAPCETVRLLAMPYASHHEHRKEEWMP